ncbi:hypothetical protein [Halorhabdus sp. BNX81]|uniref:DUF7094 domain-containing protein n=1 Tax=Halorhabdus sp. BNX81 TaxID=2980181 RepID=UPI0023DD545B|nr:hypothetical protein [Halorhabdus sp. BNX81]
MRRPPHIVTLLVALLTVVTVFGVGSAVATTVGDSPEMPYSVTPGNDTVGRLVVPGGSPTRQQATADLAGALAGDQEQLQTTVETGQFGNSFESADNESAKRTVVEETLDRLETRTSRLQTERQDALRAFAQGEIGSAGLFRELARIRAAAEGVDERAAVVETVVQQSSTLSLSADATGQLAGIDGELITLRGPVTERMAASLAGTAPSRSIGIQGGDSGVVLTTIDDGGTFVREATLWNERAESGPNKFVEGDSSALSRAYQRAQETYPWAADNMISGLSVTGFGDSTVYGVDLTHSHGDLRTYLDGRTTNVFYEVQQLRLSSLPTEAVATNTTGELLIQVNTTAIGPKTVTVRNATTGEEVIADITVEAQRVKRSTIGSRLWLLDANETRTITARRPDGTTVSITIGS